jgi:hypothetical protein
VETRLEEQGKEEKPKFDRFAGRLELDEEQKGKSKAILVKGQEELLALLQQPLSDGTVFANELAEVFASGAEGDGKAQERLIGLFGRLMTEKVAGTEKTYVAAIEEMNQRMTDDLGRIMTPDQGKKFREWAVKPSDVEMDDGPLTRFILGKIQEKNQAKAAERK